MLPISSTDGARGGEGGWNVERDQPAKRIGGHLGLRDLEAGFDAFGAAEPPVGFVFEVLPGGFLAGFLAVSVFFILPVVSVSRRCRRAASTRLPTPRPSRASWVGVEVDPEILFSGGSGEESDVFDSAEVPAFGSVASVPVESLEAVESESFAAEASLLSESDPEEPSDLELDDPPTRMAAPIPIRRRSLRLRHSGQVFSCLAVIDWKSSKAWPHASQT